MDKNMNQMTKDEALRLALKGLEIIKASCREGRTAHAENEAAIVQHIIKQALEHPEPEDYPTYDGYIKKALEQLNPPCKTGSQCTSKCDGCAEPEPVAWQYSFTHSSAIGHGEYDIGPLITDKKDVAFGVGCFGQVSLYKSPPKREPEPSDLYWRLHSLSKSLESSGRIDEQDCEGAYATLLDAMNVVMPREPLTQDEALMLALEEIRTKSVCQTARTIAKDALRKALEQPEPEILGWATHHDEPMLFPTRKEAVLYCEDDEEPRPLYTYPPKREWKGLTQQEQASVLASVPTVPFEGDWHLVLLTAIEAKLKAKKGFPQTEKNT